MWDQNVYVNDELVSNVSTSTSQQNVVALFRVAGLTSSTGKGEHGWIFYISIECAAGTCATAPAHSTSLIPHYTWSATDIYTGWEDVSIVLSTADESFGHTGSWEQGATGGKMSTSDGGKTWNFTTIEVPDTAVSRS